MGKRVHPIRFRLNKALLWNLNLISFFELKHMKYNLILNKFLILFLEKYKTWYCIYYYSIFSKQPFLFFFFFYLKNYINKRLKLFRMGSNFRRFLVRKKKKIKNNNLNFLLIKTYLKFGLRSMSKNYWIKNLSVFGVFNFFFFNVFLFFYFKKYFFGFTTKILNKTINVYRNRTLKNKYKKNRLVVKFFKIYLKYFYYFILTFFLKNTNPTLIGFISFIHIVGKRLIINFFYSIGVLMLLNTKKSIKFKKSVIFLNIKFFLKKKWFFNFFYFWKIIRVNNVALLHNVTRFFKVFFFLSLIRYQFWKLLYKKKNKKNSFFKFYKPNMNIYIKKKLIFNYLILYYNFCFNQKKRLTKRIKIIKQNRLIRFNGILKKKLFFLNYKRWLALKLFQLHLSLNLSLLLSHSISIHLINSFYIAPKMLQPKTFRILNTAVCKRYFIKNLRDKSFFLNFLNLFFLCSYFKFINAVVRFLALELIIRRRLKQLKFINLLKKILISEFFDQFLSRLQILGFYILITGKIGRKPRTQAMSILKNFRSVQTACVKISYSCKKSITFFGVLSIKFWLYYV